MTLNSAVALTLGCLNSTVVLTLGSKGGDIELNGGVGFGGDILVLFGINKAKVCINSTHKNYFLLPSPK